MDLDLQQERQQLRFLINHLSARQIAAVRELLNSMLDPFEHKLATAPIDDEPVTEEDLRDIHAAREWFKDNPGIPFEEVVSDLGLTMDEIRNYKDPAGVEVKNPA